MTDDETKAKEEAALTDRFGFYGMSPEMAHDLVEHQNDMVVTNDLNPQTQGNDNSAEFGSHAMEIGSHALEAGVSGSPVSGALVVGELAVDAAKVAMDPHAQEVEQRLGQYGGTLPDGGLPDSDGGSQ